MIVRWSELSAINGKAKTIDAALGNIARAPRHIAADSDKDLFDHLIRRSASNERRRIAGIISRFGASMDWLDAIAAVEREPKRDFT